MRRRRLYYFIFCSSVLILMLFRQNCTKCTMKGSWNPIHKAKNCFASEQIELKSLYLAQTTNLRNLFFSLTAFRLCCLSNYVPKTSVEVDCSKIGVWTKTSEKEGSWLVVVPTWAPNGINLAHASPALISKRF